MFPLERLALAGSIGGQRDDLPFSEHEDDPSHVHVHDHAHGPYRVKVLSGRNSHLMS